MTRDATTADDRDVAKRWAATARHVAGDRPDDHDAPLDTFLPLRPDAVDAGIRYESVVYTGKPAEAPHEQPKARPVRVDAAAAPRRGALDSQDVQTERTLPPREHKAFVAAMRRILVPLARADDETRRNELLHEFLDFPKLHLRHIRGKASQKERSKLMREQMGGAVFDQPAPPPPPAKTKTEAEKQQSAVKRASHMVFRSVGRAASSLVPTEEFSISGGEIEKQLREGHPTGAPPPALGRATMHPRFDEELVGKQLGKMAKGAAPGPNGWTAELLEIVARDEECLIGLTVALKDIVAGWVDEELRTRLRTCNGHPLAKTPEKVRPIAMGCAVLKLASRCQMEAEKEVFTPFFRRGQYGVMTKSGCERIVHAVRHEWETQEDIVIMTCDAKNAFNSPERLAIARLVGSTPELAGFRALFDVEYGGHSDVRWRIGDRRVTIESQRGTRQGSALGGVFFCVVLQPVLNEVMEQYPDVMVKAYMDDVTLVGKPARVAAAFQLYERLCRDIGLEMNRDKCEWLAQQPHDESARPANVKLVKGCIKLLGAYIGDDDAVRAKLAAKVKSGEAFFDRVKIAPKEVHYHVLTACGVPRLNYLTRTHAPEVLHGAAAVFDEQVCGSVAYLLGTPLTTDAEQMMQLPRKRGGAGIALYGEALADNYEASKTESLFLDGKVRQNPTKQSVRTNHRHDQRERKVRDSGDLAERALLLQAKSGCKWLSLQHRWDHTLSNDEEFAAALRRHIRCPLEGHADLALCPNHCCKRAMGPLEMQEHLTSCAKQRGENRNTTHTTVKTAIRDIATAGGLQTSDAEERYMRWICPCGPREMTRQEFTWHRDNVGCVSAAHVHISQADGKVRYDDGWWVFDNTSPNPMCPSHVDRSAESLAKAVRTKKEGLYKKKAEDEGASFGVVNMMLHGFIDEETKKQLEKLADQTQVPYAMIVADLQLKAELGASRAQLSSERRLGVAPNAKPQSRRAPAGQPLPHARPAPPARAAAEYDTAQPPATHAAPERTLPRSGTESAIPSRPAHHVPDSAPGGGPGEPSPPWPRALRLGWACGRWMASKAFDLTPPEAAAPPTAPPKRASTSPPPPVAGGSGGLATGRAAAAARWALATGPGRKIVAAWAALVTTLLLGTGFLALNVLSYIGITRLLWSAACTGFWRSVAAALGTWWWVLSKLSAETWAMIALALAFGLWAARMLSRFQTAPDGVEKYVFGMLAVTVVTPAVVLVAAASGAAMTDIFFGVTSSVQNAVGYVASVAGNATSQGFDLTNDLLFPLAPPDLWPPPEDTQCPWSPWLTFATIASPVTPITAVVTPVREFVLAPVGRDLTKAYDGAKKATREAVDRAAAAVHSAPRRSLAWATNQVCPFAPQHLWLPPAPTTCPWPRPSLHPLHALSAIASPITPITAIPTPTRELFVHPLARHLVRALRGAVSALLAQLSTGLTRTTAFIAVNILASPRLGGLVNVII